MLYDWCVLVMFRLLVLWFLFIVVFVLLCVGMLIDWVCIFDIELVVVCVVLGWLVCEGFVDQVEWGVYVLGLKVVVLYVKVCQWLCVEDGVWLWDGVWIVVLMYYLGCINCLRLQVGEWVLWFIGFVEVDIGVWVWLDNLCCDMVLLVGEFVGLGFDVQVIVFVGCGV